MSVASVRLFARMHTRVVNMLVDGPRLGAADRKLDCLLRKSLGRVGSILHRCVLSAQLVTRRRRVGGRRTACVSVVCVSEKHRRISAVSASSSLSCNTFSTSFKVSKILWCVSPTSHATQINVNKLKTFLVYEDKLQPA